MTPNPRVQIPDTKPDHPQFAYWTNADNGSLVAVFVTREYSPVPQDVLDARARVESILEQMQDDVRLLKSYGGNVVYYVPNERISRLDSVTPEKTAARLQAAQAAVPDLVFLMDWQHPDGVSIAFGYPKDKKEST